MNTEKYGRRYDDEFRRNAVDLLISSGKTRTQVARELGVAGQTLGQWKKQRISGKLGTAQSMGSAATPELEVKRLKQTVAYLERRCEILKKAIAICSQEAPLNENLR